MALAMTEEMSASLQRGLSEWWSEETEYIFQRIERWAALARGYNRLRSQRLSRGRLTMQEEQEPRWTISSNKIVIEDPNWSPRFSNLRRSHRRKPRNDENCRINCCGTFNYQASCNLDSNCLENYRYDHSIYFKTIGDIKSSKRDSSRSSDNDENSGDEQVEWQAKSPTELFHEFCIDDSKVSEEDEYDDDEEFDEYTKGNSDIRIKVDFPVKNGNEVHQVCQNDWRIVDELDLDGSDDSFVESRKIDKEEDDEYDPSEENEENSDKNNNSFNEREVVDSTEKMIQLQISQLTANQSPLESTIESTKDFINTQKNHNNILRITSMRKSRRSSRKVRQPAVAGDNNVLWPGVLLNYTKNVDNSPISPHHYRAVQVK